MTVMSAAAAITNARRAAVALPAYPGAVPDTLADAYAVQMEMIRLWDAPIGGWKIGRITGQDEQRFGKNRFIGPIFTDTIREIAVGNTVPFPIIRHGSAALEAEVIAVLSHDIPPARTDWSAREVKALLSGLHVGIEVAGSPVPDIGPLGPLASVAASGNNLGLIFGPVIADWQQVDVNMVACRTTVDGTLVGEASASALPGGPLEAVAFALNQAAELSLTLPSGTWLSTGAITGVHAAAIGQDWQADFGPHGLVRCAGVAADPA